MGRGSRSTPPMSIPTWAMGVAVEAEANSPCQQSIDAFHAEVVRQTVARRTLVLGLQEYTRRDLEAVQAAGETLQIQVPGLAIIADDVPPELARATIGSVAVLGALRASPGVRAALVDRIR
jgi:hypothetical protein